MAITRLNNNSLTSITALPSAVAVSTTPAFEAKISSTQSVSNNTSTKASFNTENFDTDNCYDHSSNYRFTPNVAGKYFVYSQLYIDGMSASNFNDAKVLIKKNGSTIIDGLKNMSNNPPKGMAMPVSAILDMNGSSDYVEIWGVIVSINNNASQFLANEFSIFGAYKLIT